MLRVISSDFISFRKVDYLFPVGKCFCYVLALEEHCADPVVFVNNDLRPTAEAQNEFSFSCEPFDDDMLSTAASDSGELIGELCSSLPPSGQEMRTSPSYIELLDVMVLQISWG